VTLSPDSSAPSPNGRGAVVLLTGLSAAGKSTLARAMQSSPSPRWEGLVDVLDGDELRQRISADLGFDPASRVRQLLRATEFAIDRANDGRVALCALIAPIASARARAREIAGPTPFMMIYIATPLSVCEERDPKGLYRRARAGELAEFTGVSSAYEVPRDADLVLDMGKLTVSEAASLAWSAVDARVVATTRAPETA
jgi:sulfate adenylyltransferase